MLPSIVTTVTWTLTYSLVILLLSAWCWVRWTHREFIREAAKIPCILRTLPILGNILYTVFGMEKFTEVLMAMNMRAVNSGVYTTCIWLGPLPLVTVHGLDDIQKILNSSNTFEKGDEMEYVNYVMRNGLLTASGNVWKVTRRHLNPLFHQHNLDQLMPEFNRNSRELVSNLSEHVGGAPVEIMEHTMDTSLKTVCQLIFGPDIEFDMNSEGFRGLMTVVKRVPDLFSKRIGRLWLRIGPLFDFLCKKELKEIDELWRTFTETPLKMTKSSIEKKMKTKSYSVDEHINDHLDADSTGPMNLLDVYSVLQNNYPQFSDDDLKSEMMTLYCTGTDTVGLAVASCLLILAQYQDMQERLYNEISSVLGSEDISIQDLQRMPYLDQVYKETLRWSTIVPYILRKPTENLKLNSCTIPAGNTIIVCLASIHMDPKRYPDPQRFDPERFSPENMKNKERYAFLPFSGGPRNCIGKTYAQFLFKVMVAHVLRRYRLSTDMDIHRMRRKLVITLVSTEGYKVSLEDRPQ